MRRPLLSHGTKPDGKRANRLTMKLLPPGFVIFSTRAAKHDLLLFYPPRPLMLYIKTLSLQAEQSTKMMTSFANINIIKHNTKSIGR